MLGVLVAKRGQGIPRPQSIKLALADLNAQLIKMIPPMLEGGGQGQIFSNWEMSRPEFTKPKCLSIVVVYVNSFWPSITLETGRR